MSTFDQLVEFGKEHPILSAMYASLFTWGFNGSGCRISLLFQENE